MMKLLGISHLLVFAIYSLILISCAGTQSRYHRVREGESLVKIASNYDVPVSSLVKKNRETIGSRLVAGTKLYIPFEDSPHWNSVEKQIERSEPDYNRSVSSVLPAKFSWPVMGGVSSPFGPRRGRDHEGVDIVAARGTPVKASRSGHVLYSGNGISGYGNLVIVKHADTYATVYAHLSQMNVKKGQFVSRGQRIGNVGSTGHARGPHLHFEIRNKQQPVNPMQFLPGQYASR